MRGCAERLAPVLAALGRAASLPGWRLRVLDGNHLPASEKRLTALNGLRGAALPGYLLVVHDPDTDLVVDMVACEDAQASERAAVAPLLDEGQLGELWIADRNFRTDAILGGWQQAGASFIVREHGRHPRLVAQRKWRASGRTATGWVSGFYPCWRQRNGVAWQDRNRSCRCRYVKRDANALGEADTTGKGGDDLVVTGSASEEISKFTMFSTEAVGGVMALEPAHTSDPNP